MHFAGTYDGKTKRLYVNGTLEVVDGVTIIRVWGSHEEMGYAYGYLLADRLTDVMIRWL